MRGRKLLVVPDYCGNSLEEIDNPRMRGRKLPVHLHMYGLIEKKLIIPG